MRVNFNEAWNEADLLQPTKCMPVEFFFCFHSFLLFSPKHNKASFTMSLSAAHSTTIHTTVKLVYVMAVKMMFTSRNFITAILCAIQKAQIIFGRQCRHEEKKITRERKENARYTQMKSVEPTDTAKCLRCIKFFFNAVSARCVSIYFSVKIAVLLFSLSIVKLAFLMGRCRSVEN